MSSGAIGATGFEAFSGTFSVVSVGECLMSECKAEAINVQLTAQGVCISEIKGAAVLSQECLREVSEPGLKSEFVAGDDETAAAFWVEEKTSPGVRSVRTVSLIEDGDEYRLTFLSTRIVANHRFDKVRIYFIKK